MTSIPKNAHSRLDRLKLPFSGSSSSTPLRCADFPQKKEVSFLAVPREQEFYIIFGAQNDYPDLGEQSCETLL